MTELKRTTSINPANALVILCTAKTNFTLFGLDAVTIQKIKKAFEQERKMITVYQGGRMVFVQLKEKKTSNYQTIEWLRRNGASIIAPLNENKIEAVSVADAESNDAHLLAFAEGAALANYQFLKYKTKSKTKETNSLRTVELVSKKLKETELEQLRITVEATCIARTLVNEPQSTLNAVELAKEFQRLGKDAGFSVTVFDKAKIKALKMGGLIAVNMGSDIPPTFTIMEYKHSRPRNKKPVVLVGKGVVFDTGGYNLKPGASMETMKCDMGGSATVGAAMWAIAKAKLPVHVIALVPATDNRINGSAYVMSDILTMYNGLTVEMLNTDAEGRLILADALSYAEQYSPELVMEFSTLTGAAAAAIGHYGIVCMGTADERIKGRLKTSGNTVYERLAEFPFWDEYDELIKSDIAEVKSIGGAFGGAITAGKFLSRFVTAPYMHFDIAGPAFIAAKDSYRTKGGTGVGVRLLFDFLSNYKK